MTGPVVLDAEAFSSLAGRPTPREREVRAAMRAADRLERDVVVPTVILAELYRGSRRSQFVDSCLSREIGMRVRDTDRRLARVVGGVLAGAGAGSDHLADAHVIAVAVETGGGLILTGDESDLRRLAAPYPNILIAPLP
ncbi:MAG TPA: type II toxin-antitoxin system VapC family toxin [Pseudonocardiaceae bacterium]|nr:type II toxin-antitoxin system VapC family toxin [Pseudonocardiaceae bacterium]